MMSAEAINLILPHPPATNNLYFDQIIWPKERGRAPYVKRTLTSEAREYKELVASLAEGITPIVRDVWLTFKWYRPRRVGDLDGIFKIIQDALTGYAYGDDKQVARIHADRFDDAAHPRVELSIRPLGLC